MPISFVSKAPTDFTVAREIVTFNMTSGGEDIGVAIPLWEFRIMLAQAQNSVTCYDAAYAPVIDIKRGRRKARA